MSKKMMMNVIKLTTLFVCSSLLSGCLITSVVSGAVGAAVDVVDTVTPDITD